MSCNTVTFKRGSTFATNCTYTPGASGPANLLATTVSSTIKDAGGSEYDLTVTVAIDGLSFTANYSGDTSTWALGMAKWDIKFDYAGGVFLTETLRINVIESVTA